MKIEDLKGCFANVNDDNLLRENGLLYAENKELKQEIEKLKNNWNKLKEWAEKPQVYICNYHIVDKMNEIEGMM